MRVFSVRFLTSYRSTIERTYTRSKGGCETKRKNLSFDRNSLCINYVIRSVGRTRSQSNVLSKPTTYSDAKNSRIDRSTRNVSSSIELATISSHLKEFPLARTTRVHPCNCIQEYLSFSPSISSGSISEYNSSVITIRKYIYRHIIAFYRSKRDTFGRNVRVTNDANVFSFFFLFSRIKREQDREQQDLRKERFVFFKTIGHLDARFLTLRRYKQFEVVRNRYRYRSIE